MSKKVSSMMWQQLFMLFKKEKGKKKFYLDQAFHKQFHKQQQLL